MRWRNGVKADRGGEGVSEPRLLNSRDVLPQNSLCVFIVHYDRAADVDTCALKERRAARPVLLVEFARQCKRGSLIVWELRDGEAEKTQYPIAQCSFAKIWEVVPASIGTL